MLLTQIATWIGTQKPWISDAARRLFLKGKLEEIDVVEILAMAKASEGIDGAEVGKPIPLTVDMIPAEAPLGAALTLLSLGKLEGVNAIAPDQSLAFAPLGLTVIYGNNGAGKSGYSRVLRKACRARATGGLILGDVFAAAKPPASAEIHIRRGEGAASELCVWRQGDIAPPELASVAVFDSHCARAFNDAEGEIAYTPRGLDVLAGLAALCVKLRSRLDAEISAIQASPNCFSDLLGDHEVGRLLASFDRQYHLPKYLGQIEALAKMSQAETDETLQLSQQLSEANPEKKATDLRRLKVRLEGLAVKWEACESALSDEKLDAAKALGASSVAADAAARAAAGAFAAEGELLPGTGLDPWRALLEAAREFSVSAAYPGHEFPHVDGARCVLCQQDLDAAAASRLDRFEVFVQQEAQKNADAARAKAQAAFAAAAWADPAGLASDEALLSEIEQLSAGATDGVKYAADAYAHRKAFLQNAWETKDFEKIAPPYVEQSKFLKEQSRLIEESAVRFDLLARADERKQSERRNADLQSRMRLGARVEQVLTVAHQLLRRRRLAAAHTAADSGKFSKKMSALHTEALSADAEAAFLRECAALRMEHVPIRSNTRMDKGRAKQQLKLATAGAEKVGDVLSEGEQRALALATFLAEVSLVPGHGAIVFDDPMSSLDHARREFVARRLAAEALVRQVIVFTHDLPFAQHLADAAQSAGALSTAMSIRRAGARAGIVHPDLPFAGIRVAERLERVKDMAKDADKALEAGNADGCDDIVRKAYGRLRETWERGVEELILCESVVRFRPGVATQRLRAVHFEDGHYSALEEAMARCSHFAAHDTAADFNTETPTPKELRADVEVARLYFANRKKANQETDDRRRGFAERGAAFKQA